MILLLGQTIVASRAIAAPSRASITTLTLTTHDVTRIYGGGFRALLNDVVSNKDVASATKAAGPSATTSLTTRDRVTGFESVWLRTKKVATLSIVNSVNLYSDSGYLHTTFCVAIRHMETDKHLHIHFSSFSGVGNEAFLMSFVTKGIKGIGILFRRGSYLVEIMSSVTHGTNGLSGVAKLAALEDQRIQAHG
jgi:hypothetical protein